MKDTAKQIADKIAEEYKDTPYFDMAEPDMDWQWDTFIYPKLKEVNGANRFSRVLEIACGHGRNSFWRREITLSDLLTPFRIRDIFFVLGFMVSLIFLRASLSFISGFCMSSQSG